MAIPQSYKAFRRVPGANAETIVPTIEHIPLLQPTEVLIRVHAVSLNYRDVGMLHGKYPVSVKNQGVPASDCAGEVVDIGSAVSRVMWTGSSVNTQFLTRASLFRFQRIFPGKR